MNHMFPPSAILIVSGVIIYLWVWRMQASDRLRRDAVVKDLEDRLRYRQNEVDALNKINEDLMTAIGKSDAKNKALLEECKSFAASVVYWKDQANKSLLGDE